MEDRADILPDLFPKAIVYVFKTIWCSVLYVLSFRRIPFEYSWESRKLGYLGLVVFTLMLIGGLLYLTSRK